MRFVQCVPGEKWVCENHLDRPWGGVSEALTCEWGLGTGSICPDEIIFNHARPYRLIPVSSNL